MTAATLALVFSGISLAVSIVLAVWQFVRYLLEGGRVRVGLQRGWLDDASLMQGPFRGGELPKDWGMTTPQLYVEVAVMVVTNKGRTAVTISDPSLDVSRERHGMARWAFWRRKTWLRHTVGPRLYEHQDSTTKRIERLEPFSSAQFVMDLQGIPRTLGERKRATWIRGSVEVAGKRLRRRSARRRALILQPGQLTVAGDTPTVQQVVYRTAKLMERDTEKGKSVPPSLAAFYVHRAHEKGDGLDWEHLNEIFDEVHPGDTGDVSGLQLAFAISEALQRHGLADGPFAPDPNVTEATQPPTD